MAETERAVLVPLLSHHRSGCWVVGQGLWSSRSVLRTCSHWVTNGWMCKEAVVETGLCETVPVGAVCCGVVTVGAVCCEAVTAGAEWWWKEAVELR